MKYIIHTGCNGEIYKSHNISNTPKNEQILVKKINKLTHREIISLIPKEDKIK